MRYGRSSQLLEETSATSQLLAGLATQTSYKLAASWFSNIQLFYVSFNNTLHTTLHNTLTNSVASAFHYQTTFQTTSQTTYQTTYQITSQTTSQTTFQTTYQTTSQTTSQTTFQTIYIPTYIRVSNPSTYAFQTHLHTRSKPIYIPIYTRQSQLLLTTHVLQNQVANKLSKSRRISFQTLAFIYQLNDIHMTRSMLIPNIKSCAKYILLRL